MMSPQVRFGTFVRLCCPGTPPRAGKRITFRDFTWLSVPEDLTGLRSG